MKMQAFFRRKKVNFHEDSMMMQSGMLNMLNKKYFSEPIDKSVLTVYTVYEQMNKNEVRA